MSEALMKSFHCFVCCGKTPYVNAVRLQTHTICNECFQEIYDYLRLNVRREGLARAYPIEEASKKFGLTENDIEVVLKVLQSDFNLEVRING